MVGDGKQGPWPALFPRNDTPSFLPPRYILSTRTPEEKQEWLRVIRQERERIARSHLGRGTLLKASELESDGWWRGPATRCSLLLPTAPYPIPTMPNVLSFPSYPLHNHFP